MNPHRTHKKNLIVSYKNLSDGLKQLFKETYPDGYSDYLQRFEKPNGDTIFVVPMETEDTVYMIKFDVKIDTTITDADADDDKDYFDEEIEKADHEFVPLSEAIEKEENSNAHTERSIRHGDYEEAASDKKRKGSLSSLGKDLEEAFDNDEYAEDEYAEKEEAPENDDDLEPTDEELMDIDSDFYLEHAEIPPEEKARMEAEQAAAASKPKRGRPRKDSSAAPAVPATPKKKGRPRKNPAPDDL